MFGGNNFSARKDHCSIYSFTMRQVTSALNKINQRISLQNCIQALSYCSIRMRTSLVCAHTQARQDLSHTHPLTQTLSPLHACAQTLRSHAKLLTHNQSSKPWQSLTQTQACFIPFTAQKTM